MDCPKCKTWNPDDKNKCWRCGTILPTPPEPKKRKEVSSQTWVWIVGILILVVTTLIQCGVFRTGDQTGSLWQQLLPLAHTLL